ncbi:MAG: hypothetical protein NTY38_15445 [Acidobacteria bacterium]|nr:hypothetical protein [Acidobacteriota bacterium]
MRITVEQEGKTPIVDRRTIWAPVAGDAVRAGAIVVWIQPPPSPVLAARPLEVEALSADAAQIEPVVFTTLVVSPDDTVEAWAEVTAR